MKIFGLYITRGNIVEALNKVLEDLKYNIKQHEEYEESLRDIHNDACLKLKEETDKNIVLSEDVKELRQRLEDTKSANAELNARLDNEISENCELQNRYAAKCKELEEANASISAHVTELTAVRNERGLLKKKQEGCISVLYEDYTQLKADAEKFRADRDKHNANRRKRRAENKKKASNE